VGFGPVPLPPRTKSLLFDDDVFDTFIGPDGAPLFTVDEAIKAWKEGKNSSSVTRRFISQHLAAIVVVGGPDHGLTTEGLIQTVRKLAKQYPSMYTDN